MCTVGLGAGVVAVVVEVVEVVFEGCFDLLLLLGLRDR